METAGRTLKETRRPLLQVTMANVNKDACLPSATMENRGLCLAACEKGAAVWSCACRRHLGNKNEGEGIPGQAKKGEKGT